jgi:lipopolysaccharide/colanic/teichoic acid biosynthesis glycosyltransferase
MFGDVFTVYKFRTLKPEPEGEVGTVFADDRRTPLGNFLRVTHLDEIPQLWSILVGDMSVVGPRPAQTDIEDSFRDEATTWKRRWFVKPGLTGLAQINDATSQEPSVKIKYDVKYIHRQSFTFDVKIVLRQLWQVVQDIAALDKTTNKRNF